MPSRIPTHKPVGHDPVAEAAFYRRGKQRAADNRFYCSRPWRKLREAFLREHPLCDECTKRGRTTAASQVHHIAERRDHLALALDWDNLQALCHVCHLEKRCGK